MVEKPPYAPEWITPPIIRPGLELHTAATLLICWQNCRTPVSIWLSLPRHLLFSDRRLTAIRVRPNTSNGSHNSPGRFIGFSGTMVVLFLTSEVLTKKGLPTRSLYNFRVLIKFHDEIGFHLAEDFYWFNPSKLPSPIEWVNKRKLRAKDAVNTVWWFSKTEWPKADTTKVLAPYSARMTKLLKDPPAFYTPKVRPSGHDIGKAFSKDNGGALPSNLLRIPNTESNGQYLDGCRTVGETCSTQRASRCEAAGILHQDRSPTPA